MLRKILGGRREELLERQNNLELQGLYGKKSTTQFIKVQRIWWLGDVERMAEDQMVQKVCLGTVIRRRQDRPKAWQLSALLNDLGEKGVRNQKVKARNREQQRQIVKLWV